MVVPGKRKCKCCADCVCDENQLPTQIVLEYTETCYSTTDCTGSPTDSHQHSYTVDQSSGCTYFKFDPQIEIAWAEFDCRWEVRTAPSDCDDGSPLGFEFFGPSTPNDPTGVYTASVACDEIGDGSVAVTDITVSLPNGGGGLAPWNFGGLMLAMAALPIWRPGDFVAWWSKLCGVQMVPGCGCGSIKRQMNRVGWTGLPRWLMTETGREWARSIPGRL